MPAAEKNYLDPHVLGGIKRLDLRARHVVEGYLTGMHKSPYNGFAVEFASHREYVPGDEIKHIDWKLWSRTDRLYIKEYEEETNLRCTVVLDASKSMAYGSKSETGLSKYDYAATAAAALAHILQSQQDMVGLVQFTDKIEATIPPSGNLAHLKRLVHQMEVTEPESTTDFDGVFHSLAEQIPKRGMVVFLSDLFTDPALIRDSLEQFRLRKHDVVVFHIMHDDELEFPFSQNTQFRGLEVDEQLQTDPRALRKAYLKVVGDYLEAVRKGCDDLGVDYVLFNTKEPIDALLNQFLAFRQRSFGRRRR